MKILFVSDIHGSATALEKVLDIYARWGGEMLCIVGDIINYGPRNGLPDGLSPQLIVQRLNALSDQIVAVRGNCDSEVDQMLLSFPIMGDYAVVCDGRRRFLLTHGHKLLNDKGQAWFKADIVVTGHTHLWSLERDPDGTVFLNTGSPTFPKGGRQPTCALYDGKSIKVVSTDGETLKEISLE